MRRAVLEADTAFPLDLRLAGTTLAPEWLSLLFPGCSRRGGEKAAIVAWAGSPGLSRHRDEASRRGVPFAALGPGLLRAPPVGPGPPPILGICAHEIAGPASPLDRLSPQRAAVDRDMLARARAGRLALGWQGEDAAFAASALAATRYLDPFRRIPATFEEMLALVLEWRRIEAANRGIAVCVGMSFWKRRRVADFLRSGAGRPRFRRTVSGATAAARRTGGAIAVWRSRIPAGLEAAAARHGIPLVRVEDGFVRSVGLGSDFLPPASLVLDARGMYFDPRSKSDLETLLCETAFDPALVARAARLIELLVQRGVTKYNLAGRPPAVAWPRQGRRILVPGQVEDDLSVVLGGGAIKSNLALLAEVRAANPDAFIVYKPHPDVLAGHRRGAVAEAAARRYADAVVAGGAAASLLGLVDEVHTLTSLAGFEALLRRRRVVVYGTPFYAGWGVTDDRAAIARGRRLSLEELVAGTLILYPRYLDPVTRLPCGPEVIVERLDRPELWRGGALVAARRLQGAARRWWAGRGWRTPPLAPAGRDGDG